MKYDTYDTTEVLQAADFETVAAAVGLVTGKPKGKGGIPFLCPAHKDKEIGNCYYSREKRVWHCFSCHAKGNLADLVAYQLYGDCAPSNFYKAIEFIAQLYRISPNNERSVKKELPFVSLEEQNLLGIYNGSIRIIRNCSIPDADEPPEYDSELAETSLLFSLYKDDFEAYKMLLCRKFNERYEEYKKREEEIRKLLKERLEKNDLRGYYTLQAFFKKELLTVKQLEGFAKKYKIKVKVRR